jgi:hypothetical protein
MTMPQESKIKRSRRVVLTLMGTAAVSAVSMGFVPRGGCGPGSAQMLGPDGRHYCRAAYGGFGGHGFRAHNHVHGGGG